MTTDHPEREQIEQFRGSRIRCATIERTIAVHLSQCQACLLVYANLPAEPMFAMGRPFIGSQSIFDPARIAPIVNGWQAQIADGETLEVAVPACDEALYHVALEDFLLTMGISRTEMVLPPRWPTVSAAGPITLRLAPDAIEQPLPADSFWRDLEPILENGPLEDAIQVWHLGAGWDLPVRLVSARMSQWLKPVNPKMESGFIAVPGHWLVCECVRWWKQRNESKARKLEMEWKQRLTDSGF